MRSAEGGVTGRDAGGSLPRLRVRPGVHVIRDVIREDASEPGGTEYDHVIQASDRADAALDVGVLPRRSRCRDDLMDLHRAESWTRRL